VTAFILVAVLLVATGAAFVLWPLLRGGGGGSSSAPSDGSVVARFRRQRKELDAEHAAGRLAEAAWAEACAALERRLVDAIAGTAPAAEEAAGGAAAGAAPRRAIGTAAVALTVLLAVPAGLYAWRGAPELITPEGLAAASESAGGGSAGESAGGAKQITPAQVQKMIAGLEDSLKKNPNDGGAWMMLARAHAYLKQFPEAVRAYTEAVARNPRDPRLLADLADALAMVNGQKLDGEPMKLIERALQIDPKDVKALALAGTFAFEHQQYAKSVDYWERAVAAAGNDAEFGDNLRSSLAEARRLAGGPAASGAAAARGPAAMSSAPTASSPALPPQGAFVKGRVQLAPALAAKLKPGDVLFVFARASAGPRMPLALLRRQAQDLPLEFTLDESMAMTPDISLSKYPQVTISARVSHSGDALPASGDLEGSSGTVAVGSSGVRVLIDHVVTK
jgi:cytochrome c-type biogenesis protein CcmH